MDMDSSTQSLAGQAARLNLQEPRDLSTLSMPGPSIVRQASTKRTTGLERTLSVRSNSSVSPTSSPTLSFTPSLNSRLQKSDSTRSVGRVSVRSHTSVGAIGQHPFGTLHLVGPSEGSETGSDADSPATERNPSGAESAAAKLSNIAREMSTGSDPLQGDMFLILDLPEKFTIGHDHCVVTNNSKVLASSIPGARDPPGIRDVPPGTHFFWVSAPGSLTRCGYWYVAHGRGEVRVKQWDRYNETLGEAASKNEVRFTLDRKSQIYPKLLPYNHGEEDRLQTPPGHADRRKSAPVPDFVANERTLWRVLTSAIDEDFLIRVTGQDQVREWLVDSTDTAKGETPFPSTGTPLKAATGVEMKFSFGPHHVEDPHVLRALSTSSSSSDRTTHAVSAPTTDMSSRVLERVRNVGDNVLAGELQYAFVTGTHLGNYSCVEYWWHVVLAVILRAPGLALTRPQLCRKLLQTFHAQMVHDDRYLKCDGTDAGARGSGSVFEYLPQNKTRLREALTLYKRRLNELLLGLGDRITQEQGAVGHAFADLEAWFWKFSWDLRSDYVPPSADAGAGTDGVEDAYVPRTHGSDDEYVPVVVQLDKNGREVGLVSWN